MYGITWGAFKARCRQEITSLRLPIGEVESVVYAALVAVVGLHNRLRSPVFTRWNGANYTPSPLVINELPISTPFFGLVLPNDADVGLDNPVYRVYDVDGVKEFRASTLAEMIQKRASLVYSLLADYSPTEVNELIYNAMVLEAEDASTENLYACVGNILFLYPQGTPVRINKITYMYFYVPSYPTSDSEVLRLSESLLEHCVLKFKEMYLARYGQLLDWRSQQRLMRYERSIRQGD